MTSPERLIVTADPSSPQRGILRQGTRTFDCVLGRSGIHGAKREGDGATPTGAFPLRRILYRADRLRALKTRLPYVAIAQGDGWCDAPEDARYNQPVKLPYPASTESMWRDDGLYDVVVVLGHNDDPVVAYAGSAIFMHVASHEPTAGCVALAREDLLAILEYAGPDTWIEIQGA
jgi:L,D-peptidoglycan transpeptidase YkuD (ErfK/YbiS/YcfS/YnhG family)